MGGAPRSWSCERCGRAPRTATMVASAPAPMARFSCSSSAAFASASRASGRPSAASARSSIRSYGPGPRRSIRRCPESSSGSPATTRPHGGREDVDAAHVEHVVGAAGDAEPPGGAPAGARPGAGHRDGVAAAVAHERLALAREMRAHQLAGGALGDRQPLERGRVDDLGEHDVAGVEVQVGRLLALRAEDRQHLRQAEVRVAHREAPRLLEPRAGSRRCRGRPRRRTGRSAGRGRAARGAVSSRSTFASSAGYDGVHEIAFTPSSRITSISARVLPTPNGTTVAPAASRIRWSVTPPVHSW